MKKYLACIWILMSYRQPQTYQIATQTAITTGNITRRSPKIAKRVHHQGLVREQRPDTTRHTNVLDILRWHDGDWWHHTQGQACSYTWVFQKTDIRSTPPKSHGNRKSQTLGTWINFFDKHQCLYWKAHKNVLHVWIHHDIPAKPWEIVGTDMFTLCCKKYLCIVNYHSKFPIINIMEDISADSLILTCKIIFAEFGLPKKATSNSGGNFISDKFKTSCRGLNIKQAF